MHLKNAFWDFALEFYQQSGVEQTCLKLQEEYGLSINRILFACWGGVRGTRLCDEAYAGPSFDWQKEITHPLRAVRYKVREDKARYEELDQCYQALRQAELKCEQVEIALLFANATSLPQSTPSLKLAEENLHSYLKFSNLAADKEIVLAVAPLLEALKTYLGTIPVR